MNKNIYEILGTAACMAAVLLIGYTCHAQWLPVRHLNGSNIQSGITSVVSAGPDTLLASTPNAGVLISINRGATWQEMYRGLPATSTVPGNLSYCATNTCAGRNGVLYTGTTGYGLYTRRATDTKWVRVPGLDTSASILDVAYRNDTLLVATFLYGLWALLPNNDTLHPLLPATVDTPLTITDIHIGTWGTILCTKQVGYVLYNSPSDTMHLNQGFLNHSPMEGVVMATNDAGWAVGSALLTDTLCCGIAIRDGVSGTWQRFDADFPTGFTTIFDVTSYGNMFLAGVGYFGGIGVWTWSSGEEHWRDWSGNIASLTIDAIYTEQRGGDTVRVFAGSRKEGLYYRDTVMPVTSIREYDDVDGSRLASRSIDIIDRSDARMQQVEHATDVCGRTWRKSDMQHCPAGLYIVTLTNRPAPRLLWIR